MEKLVVTRRKGGSFESRSPQAYPLQHGYASQREKVNWHGVGIPLERRGKWPAAPTQGSNRRNEEIPYGSDGQQRGRPATLSPQRTKAITEPQISHVWGTNQPLPKSRTPALVEIRPQGKPIVHQELDRAFVERNPVCGQGGTPGHRGASTGVRQSNRISITRVILPPDVVRQTLEQLPLREATMVLIDAVTALRASELVALKWRNVGWDTGILRSEFAFVEGELKDTKSRNNALPLARPVLNVLRLWREHTPYRTDEDWIFASPHYHGKTPYTYQILFRRHIRPVIERVSTLKSSKLAPIGWHTLRRSLATLLISNGENVKVAQSQLRHTTPKITLELYAQAVSADQQKAHRKVVQMVLPAKFPEKLKARSAAPTA